MDADLRSATVFTFALIVPDLCHDLYGALTCWRGSRLERAENAFVREWAAKIMASGAWKDHATLVITFDEGGGGDRAGGSDERRPARATPMNDLFTR